MSRLLRNIFMFVVYAYLYIPIIILVTNSFNEDRYGLSWKGFSWNWYERLFNNDTLIQAAFHSVTIAFFAATLATIVGGLTAIALYRYRFRGKQAVSGMLFIVMMSPDIVMAVSLLALFMVEMCIRDRTLSGTLPFVARTFLSFTCPTRSCEHG